MNKTIDTDGIIRELRALRFFVDNNGTGVRLQYDGGLSYIHTGDASYDTDHHGHWGAGYLDNETDCEYLAKDLIDQVLDSIEMD